MVTLLQKDKEKIITICKDWIYTRFKSKKDRFGKYLGYVDPTNNCSEKDFSEKDLADDLETYLNFMIDTDNDTSDNVFAKDIYFLIDGLVPSNLDFLNGCKICQTFKATEEEITNGCEKIATNSMAHFSFDLLDKGYNIYLVNDGNIVKITPHMSEIDKDLKRGHNIRKLFLAGVFDELVNYER